MPIREPGPILAGHPLEPVPVAAAFKSIQRGETTVSVAVSAGYVDVAITAVNLAKSRLRWNGMTFANSADGYSRVALALTSSTNLRIYWSTDNITTSVYVSWEIEESENFKSVQRAVTTVALAANERKTQDVTITTVNVSKSRARYLGIAGTTRIVNGYAVGGNVRLYSATAIRIHANNSNGGAYNFYVSWEAEEIK